MNNGTEPKLLTALRRVIEVLEKEKVRYALIGGLAAVLYGSERSTMDIDLLFAIEKLRLPGLLKRFVNEGFDFSEKEVLQELTKEGLSQIKYKNIAIDLLTPIMPFFNTALSHSRKIEISDIKITVVSVDDLIIFKLLSLREEDKKDIEAMTAIYRDQINISYIKEWLEKIFSPDDERFSFFEKYLKTT